MMLVIDTQDRENYAAHQGFTGEYYWKMKGGQSYKILNVPQGADPAEIVELVRGDIEDSDNNYFRSEIIDYNLQDDGWMSPFERRDRKSTRLNSSHSQQSRMPSSA